MNKAELPNSPERSHAIQTIKEMDAENEKLTDRVRALEALCKEVLAEEGPEVCLSEKLRAKLTAAGRGEAIGGPSALDATEPTKGEA